MATDTFTYHQPLSPAERRQRNRHEMIDALFLKAVRLFQDGLDRVWTDYPLDWERVRVIFELNVLFAHQDPDLYELWSGPRPWIRAVREEHGGKSEGRGRRLARNREVIEAGVMAPPLPTPEAIDLLIAVIRGLTAVQVANEPEVSRAAGRFGKLVPWTVALFQSSWAATAHDGPSLPARKHEEEQQ